MAYGQRTRLETQVVLEKQYVKMGKLLRRARMDRGMTQQDVADALDLKKQTVSRHETGLGAPTVANLMHYCALFRLTPAEMLQDENACLREPDQIELGSPE